MFKKLTWLANHARNASTQCRTPEEIRIPMPWGYLAGKWWGPQDKRPILLCHGWQDNCGTFDTLIPYLPKHLGYLAIDFPGHGFSTRLPPSIFYHSIDTVVTLKRIAQYFNWPKISLIGHSLGASTAFVYTLLYPTMVDFLICIDGLKPLLFEENKLERLVNNMERFIKYDNLNSMEGEPPSHTFEELQQKFHEATRKSVTLESSKYLLRRNIASSKKEPNKFYFSRDARLKVISLLNWAHEDIADNVHRIKCPFFLSKTKYSPFFENKQRTTEIIELIQQNNKNFECHNVGGTHHVHLNNPELLEGLISAFLKKYDVEDRSKGGLKQEMKLK